MEPDNIESRLAEPFEPSEVRWKPAVVSGNRAMALAYVDARVVMDRLDDVFGVAGWQDEYTPQADGSCLCKLRCRFGEEWITKMDVGGQSEQPDEGDRDKAAISDALKRTAVKFGIGRYLYRLPSQWVDYDPAKKRFVTTPMLPGSALPAKKAVSKEAPKKEPAKGNGNHPSHGRLSPKTAAELLPWLQEIESWLVQQGWCKQHEFVLYVQSEGAENGFPADIPSWSEKEVGTAVPFARETAAKWKRGEKPEPQPA